MAHMLSLQFPDPPVDHLNSQQTANAYAIVKNDYGRSASILLEDECEPIRLQIHYRALLDRTIPLFEALMDDLPRTDEGWAHACLERLLTLALMLDEASKLLNLK